MAYTSAKSRPNYVFDANLEFKDAGLVAASAAATVDGSAKVVDLGTGFFKADMVVDISAIEVATGDENYRIAVQLSDNSDFSTGAEVEGASIDVGDSSTTLGDTDDAAGRRVFTFDNRGADGTTYRYARVYTTVAGTIATGINFTAFAANVQR